MARIEQYVHQADYSQALTTCLHGRRKWPEDFKIQSAYASVLGDRAEDLPPERRQRLKRKAAGLLKGLLPRLREVSALESLRTRNEYYYHSEQFLKQYQLGRAYGVRGLYSQGVGAAWHAKRLAEEGRKMSARRWAERSIEAWERYFKVRPDYYNAYVHYALVLGILSRLPEMEKALEKSTALSGRPASYREFQEVREIVEKLAPQPSDKSRTSRRR